MGEGKMKKQSSATQIYIHTLDFSLIFAFLGEVLDNLSSLSLKEQKVI